MNVPERVEDEWIRKAEEDELSAKAVLKEGAPSTGCFLAQQIAEKYLKALLIRHRLEFPKTHDLIALASLVEPRVQGVRVLQDDLKTLGRYYVETRYPGDYSPFTREECQHALEAALRVKDFVMKRLSSG
ncbi:MAG: HEPN domain-containing protein [Parcubacteria group bacterium Gr01-1014_38]|nr:MAG: HEPN domain-containing protein [Parcubacteria group bacterium Gr01-1014_38]